jgi:hypothetical protein
MTQDELDAVTEAIVNRRVVHLSYRSNPGQRTFHPHAIFESQDGTVHLDGLQTAGPTRDPHPLPIWRTFLLTTITDVATTGTNFIPDARFNPRNTRKYHRMIVSC